MFVFDSIRWPVLLPLVVLMLACMAPRANAQQPGKPKWVVLPLSADADHLEDARSLAARLEGSLRASGAPVLDASQARERFEAVHSKPPVVLQPDALEAVREQVQKATQHLALNQLQDALDATRKLRSMSAQAQDYVRRELARARELFDICVVTARQMDEGGKREQARRHMLHCVQSYPGLQPEADFHAPAVHELYETVLANLDENRPATLIVRSASADTSCTTRVNGISWGPAPAEIKTAPATVRIQLECGDQPGRVHTLSLEPGLNETTIDPIFDTAVRSQPRLALVYANPERMRERRVQDALTVARSVNASHVVQVERGDAVTIRKLRAGGGSVQEWQWQAALDDVSELSRMTRVLTTPEPAEAPEASRPPEETSTRYTSALHVLAMDDSLAWLVPTSIATGYAIALGGTLWALAERADRRHEALGSSSFELSGYNTAGTLGLAVTAGGSALATGMELIGLPERDGIPWWAWLAGAGGVAAAGAGAVVWASVDACAIGDDRVGCGSWSRDELLGPLLLLHSAPLLSVPLTYLLAEAIQPGATATLRFDGRAARLHIRGSF